MSAQETVSENSLIPQGHLNMKALGEKEGMQEYEDCSYFTELLAAKQALQECIIHNKNSYFILRGESGHVHLEQAYLTLCNELICHVIRDDSPIADSERDTEESMYESCRLAIQVTSLRERLEVEIHTKNIRPLRELQAGIRRLKSAQKEYLAAYSAGTREVNPLRIWGALHPHIERYGKILQLEDQPVVDGLQDKPFYYVNGEVTQVKMGGDSPVEIGRIVIKKRPFSLFVMDNHQETSEVLTPDRHCIIPFAEKDSLDSPCFNGELFLVPPGAWIHINQGTIHYAPFPLFDGVLTSSVIFAEGTTTAKKADFHHHHFPYKRRFL